MRVMFTVFYLTIGFNGLSLSARLCPLDPVSFTMDQMESIVYALANDKGVQPTVILNRLLRKVKIRQRNEKVRPKSQLQEIALDELIHSDSLPKSPPKSGGRMRQDRLTPMSKQPLLPSPPSPDRGSPMSGSFYPPPLVAVPPPPQQQGNNVMTGMMIPPGFPPQLPRMVPHSIFIPFPNISPPPGVTIRIKAGNSINKIPEVTITLSPMMTIVEALKQAESKFRSVLEPSLMSEEELISFSYSSYAECYVIRSLDGIESNENGIWKIIVSEISGKVIYDSVCLPSRDEVPVKPGMTITLLFTLA